MEPLNAFRKLRSVPKEFRESHLWSILTDTVRSMPLYNEHKSYVRDNILPSNPGITFGELSALLGIPLGEAMVILNELRIWWDEVEEEIRRDQNDPKFKKAALGGTFNIPHSGHLILIHTALKHSERAIIGITEDGFAQTLGKKYKVRSLEERLRDLRSILSSRGWIDRCEIVVISDPYGPAVEDPGIEVLVVSPLTLPRAPEINQIRIERGLKPLKVIVCPLVVAEDSKIISSTRIVFGEIDPSGRMVKRD